MRLIIATSTLTIVVAIASACGRGDSAEEGRPAEAGAPQATAAVASEAITVTGDTAFVKGVAITVSKQGITVKFPSSEKVIPWPAVTSWTAGAAFSIIYDDGKTPNDTHPGTLDDIQSVFFIPMAGEDMNRVAALFRKSLPAELEKKQ